MDNLWSSKPCIVKLMDGDKETTTRINCKGFKIKNVSLAFLLSKDPKIPVGIDWVVTMTEPVDELRKHVFK